ncbi:MULTISPECIES: plasmid stabilization protein [unclassified Meiothermus]|uniref:plasmid stabilization protein n=1 Tax=unclassified Meiothermus TaxID=370471 RepID=UPI000D7BE9B7|nr:MULTISPECIES: plasmid stabilization protein [unclassified Meiothermus]PZA08874.1 plasmid stabilization protein [Meiothermus sp. Pnk-1]RYM33741.1 plasmid stabilization protein [Meiothermus sp. PNK-Is4]
MPRGDKSAYTDKQKRKAQHIEESYRERGVSEGRAEQIAWATVNKQDGGGKKSGAGRGRSARSSSPAGDPKSKGEVSRTRSEAAKKGWETRRRKAAASR